MCCAIGMHITGKKGSIRVIDDHMLQVATLENIATLSAALAYIQPERLVIASIAGWVTKA